MSLKTHNNIDDDDNNIDDDDDNDGDHSKLWEQ